MAEILSENNCTELKHVVEAVLQKYSLKLHSKTIILLDDDGPAFWKKDRIFIPTQRKSISELAILSVILHEDSHAQYNMKNKDALLLFDKILNAFPEIKYIETEIKHPVAEFCACFMEFKQLKSLLGEDVAKITFKRKVNKFIQIILDNYEKIDKIFASEAIIQ